MGDVRETGLVPLRTIAFHKHNEISCINCGSTDVRDMHFEFGHGAMRETEDVTLCDRCGYVQTRVVALKRAS